MRQSRCRSAAVSAGLSAIAVFLLTLLVAGEGQGASLDGPPGGGQKTSVSRFCDVTRVDITHLAAPKKSGDIDADLSLALTRPDVATGKDFKKWSLQAAAAAPFDAPGTLKVVIYDVDQSMETPPGGAPEPVARVELTLDWEDGTAAPKPPNRRWIQVIVTDGFLNGVRPEGAAATYSTPYMDPNPGTDVAAGATEELPFYYTSNDLAGQGTFGKVVDLKKGEGRQPAPAPADFRFDDGPLNSCWGSDLKGKVVAKSGLLKFKAWLVDWDGKTPGTVTIRDGFTWGFRVDGKLPAPAKQANPKGKRQNPTGAAFTIGQKTLEFDRAPLDSIVYSDGTEGSGDPVLGADIVISDLRLVQLPHIVDRGRGAIEVAPSPGAVDGYVFPFGPANLQVVKGGNVVLTADLTSNFLFEWPADSSFDSEFQSVLSNVEVDNSIGSRYLSEVETFLRAAPDNQLAWTFRGNLVAATGELQWSGSADGSSELSALAPPSVGGTTDLPVVGDAPASAAAGGGDDAPYVAIAGGAAAVLAIAGGGWYARRRFRQRRIGL